VSNWYPPPARPRPVEGGLQARSARGPIARTWWSERFIGVLENIGLGSRLQRGRTYARQGQTISLDVDAGLVTALVQGSRARPYRVRIGIHAFDKTEWAQAERALAGNAWYAARLLAGDLPDGIEDLFAGLGLALFPAAAADLSLDCSCPDVAVPCKHLAAIFYLLAESFDDDPFTILAWRGRDREDLLANLHAARSEGPPAADHAERAGRPLADCLDSFYARQGEIRLPPPPVAPSAAQLGALLGQLPDLAVTVRGQPLTDLLRPAYQAIAAPADQRAAGTGRS